MQSWKAKIDTTLLEEMTLETQELEIEQTFELVVFEIAQVFHSITSQQNNSQSTGSQKYQLPDTVPPRNSDHDLKI